MKISYPSRVRAMYLTLVLVWFLIGGYPGSAIATPPPGGVLMPGSLEAQADNHDVFAPLMDGDSPAPTATPAAPAQALVGGYPGPATATPRGRRDNGYSIFVPLINKNSNAPGLTPTPTPTVTQTPTATPTCTPTATLRPTLRPATPTQTLVGGYPGLAAAMP